MLVLVLGTQEECVIHSDLLVSVFLPERVTATLAGPLPSGTLAPRAPDGLGFVSAPRLHLGASGLSPTPSAVDVCTHSCRVKHPSGVSPFRGT